MGELPKTGDNGQSPKKRRRHEVDELSQENRKQKKSKTADTEPTAVTEADISPKKSSKKSKKKSSRGLDSDAETRQNPDAADDDWFQAKIFEEDGLKEANGMSPEGLDASAQAEAIRESTHNKKKKKDKHKHPRHGNDDLGVTDETLGTFEEVSKEKKKKKNKHDDLKPRSSSKSQGGNKDALESGHKKRKSKHNRVEVANGEEVPKGSIQEEIGDGEPVFSHESQLVERPVQQNDAVEHGKLEQPVSAASEATRDKKKKKKKEKSSSKTESALETSLAPPAETSLESIEGKKALKEKKQKKKKRREEEKLHREEADPFASDQMAVDSPVQKTRSKATAFRPADAPDEVDYPFFAQTVSLYVPLFPVDFDKPREGIADQQLKHLVNHYSVQFGGVLLDYRSVHFSQHSIRPKSTHSSTDDDSALLISVDEYAPAFGWMTVDVDLFMPHRGSFMEGTINLQSEGHLGLVCWGKFNASIEAKRLPQDWQFIEIGQQTEPSANGEHLPDPFASADEEEDGDNVDTIVAPMHVSGYWVDGAKRPVKGKMVFRVKDFDVGVAGEHGYMSIVGTMLTEDDEKALAAEEAETLRRRNLRMNKSMLRREQRIVPKFSMTKLGHEFEEESSEQRQELYKGSRPTTPDD